MTTLVSPPIWLALSGESCYRCNKPTPVVLLVALRIQDLKDEWEHAITGPFLLYHVQNFPPHLAAMILKIWPLYHLDSSKTLNLRSWMNHCRFCHAKLGDHYLVAEPEDAFHPVTTEHAAALRFISLNHETVFRLQCSYATNSSIDEHSIATQITHNVLSHHISP